MRWLGGVVLAALLASVWTIGSTDQALACSCAHFGEYDTLAQIDESPTNEMLFRGEQIAETPADDGGLNLTFRVDRVYRGDFAEDTIEVLSNQAGCAQDSQAEYGVAAFNLYKRGDWQLAACGEPLNPYVVDALVDGLPEPVGKDPPEFIVGHDLGPAVVSLLDRQGQIIRSGERVDPTDHTSQVRALTTCQGGESVGLVLDNANENWGRPDRLEYRFELRSMSDLQIESAAVIGFDRVPQVWPLARATSLECHAGETGLMSLLLTRPRRGPAGSVQLDGPAQVVVFESGELSTFEVPVARSMTVDPVARLAYLLNEDGTSIISWDIDAGAPVDEFSMPAGSVGWYVRMAGDELQILGRGAPPADEPDLYPRINRLISGAPDALTMQLLDARGGLIDVTPNGDGLIVLLRNPDQIVYIEPDARTVAHPLAQTASRQVAIGSEVTLVAYSWGWPNKVGLLGPDRIPAQQLQHLGAAEVIVAIDPGDEPLIALPAAATTPAPQPEEPVAVVQPIPNPTTSGDNGIPTSVWIGVAAAGCVATGLGLRSRGGNADA